MIATEQLGRARRAGGSRARPAIGILTATDSRRYGPDWATTANYMGEALQRHCGEVVHLDPVSSPVRVLGKAANRVARRLRQPCDFSNTRLQARDWARVVARRIAGIDVILAASAAPLVALLETTVPILYTSDATFDLVRDYYPFYTRLPAWNVRTAEQLEQRALSRAAWVTYPSAWAAASARNHYGVDAHRLSVVPYGANFDDIPSRARSLAARSTGACRLLFVGVEWERKGGAIALRTLQALRGGGVDAELAVVGCEPPRGADLSHVRVFAHLSKENRAERERLSQLYLDSHFLLLPTRAECYGMVFCEASAHGTPSIATDTGGVHAVVAGGENGVLLPPTAGAEDYAAVITGLLADRGRYAALVASTRDAYESRLNWDAWGRRVAEVISSLVAR